MLAEIPEGVHIFWTKTLRNRLLSVLFNFYRKVFQKFASGGGGGSYAIGPIPLSAPTQCASMSLAKFN
jgi:hypothetical protein